MPTDGPGSVAAIDELCSDVIVALYPDVRRITAGKAARIAEHHAAVAALCTDPALQGVPSTINFTYGKDHSRVIRRSKSHELMFRALSDNIWPTAGRARRIIEQRIEPCPRRF